jgi:hypothetical protein
MEFGTDGALLFVLSGGFGPFTPLTVDEADGLLEGATATEPAGAAAIGRTDGAADADADADAEDAVVVSPGLTSSTR